MSDHGTFSEPTDKQSTFLRLTPVPKRETTPPPTKKASITTNDENANDENANSDTNPTTTCPCINCANHGSPNAGATNAAQGLKALTNCACSPCSSADSAAWGGGEGFEMLLDAALVLPDVGETVAGDEAEKGDDGGLE